MKLAVRYMGLVALLAMAPLAWASEPTDGERFRLRLHSTERYAIPGVGGGTMVRVEAPFLCITDAGRADFGAIPADDDTASFLQPCEAAAGNGAQLGVAVEDMDRYRSLLLAAFEHSTPLMQRLLLSPRLKRLSILVGSGVNGASTGIVVDDAPGGRGYIYALAVNAAVFALDDNTGLETYQSYYEGFQTLRGGTEHRAEHLVGNRSYVAMPKGPVARLHERKGASAVRGPVGVLLKIFHHELGHFALSILPSPALVTPPGGTHEQDQWSDASLPASVARPGLRRESNAPQLFFAQAPDNRALMSYELAPPLDAARARFCFARTPQCGVQRSTPGSRRFAADFVALYRGTGLLDSIATWKPDEAFCEWMAFDSLQPYVHSLRLYPTAGAEGIDVFEQMRRFRNRAEVMAYLAYRQGQLAATL